MKSIPDDAGYFMDEYDGPRFWEHVNPHGGKPYLSDPLARIDTSAGECWEWRGWHVTAEGYEYGRFRIGGGTQQAHRLAFKDFGFNVSDEQQIDHLCRNARCVRPTRLEAVTQLENVHRGLVGARTHCVNGHEFTSENTRIIVRNGNERRLCKTCRRKYANDLYHRRIAAA